MIQLVFMCDLFFKIIIIALLKSILKSICFSNYFIIAYRVSFRKMDRGGPK